VLVAAGDGAAALAADDPAQTLGAPGLTATVDGLLIALVGGEPGAAVDAAATLARHPEVAVGIGCRFADGVDHVGCPSVHPGRASRRRRRQHQAANERGTEQREVLRYEAPDREAQNIDLLQAQGANEGCCVIGHLLECAGQLCGGYFADPGRKEIPGIAHLGFPFADVQPDANALLGRAAGISQSLKKYDITLNVPPAVK